MFPSQLAAVNRFLLFTQSEDKVTNKTNSTAHHMHSEVQTSSWRIHTCTHGVYCEMLPSSGEFVNSRSAVVRIVTDLICLYHVCVSKLRPVNICVQCFDVVKSLFNYHLISEVSTLICRTILFVLIKRQTCCPVWTINSFYCSLWIFYRYERVRVIL